MVKQITPWDVVNGMWAPPPKPPRCPRRQPRRLAPPSAFPVSSYATVMLSSR